MKPAGLCSMPSGKPGVRVPTNIAWNENDEFPSWPPGVIRSTSR